MFKIQNKDILSYYLLKVSFGASLQTVPWLSLPSHFLLYLYHIRSKNKPSLNYTYFKKCCNGFCWMNQQMQTHLWIIELYWVQWFLKQCLTTPVTFKMSMFLHDMFYLCWTCCWRSSVVIECSFRYLCLCRALCWCVLGLV